MNIEITTQEDEFFKIEVKKFGEQYLASDGERVAIGVTEQDAVQSIEEMTPEPVKSNAAPLENSREGHPFDFFGGTSWAGKRNGFN